MKKFIILLLSAILIAGAVVWFLREPWPRLEFVKFQAGPDEPIALFRLCNDSNRTYTFPGASWGNGTRQVACLRQLRGTRNFVSMPLDTEVSPESDEVGLYPLSPKSSQEVWVSALKAQEFRVGVRVTETPEPARFGVVNRAMESLKLYYWLFTDQDPDNVPGEEILWSDYVRCDP